MGVLALSDKRSNLSAIENEITGAVTTGRAAANSWGSALARSLSGASSTEGVFDNYERVYIPRWKNMRDLALARNINAPETQVDAEYMKAVTYGAELLADLQKQGLYAGEVNLTKFYDEVIAKTAADAAKTFVVGAWVYVAIVLVVGAVVLGVSMARKAGA